MIELARTETAESRAAGLSASWISILVGSAILGIVLRLDGIGASLWLDEFGTLWTVENSLRAAWNRATTFHGQTPFYYTFAWISIRLLGESEISLRLPSLVFGLATWAALAVGAWKLFGYRAGVLAFFVAAVDPTLVHASADARPYALAFLMLSLTILGFVGTCLRQERGTRAMWVTCGAGTIWAHYVFYPFVLGIVSAYLMTRSFREQYNPRRFSRDLLAHIVLVALSAPQFIQLFARREELDWVSHGYTGGGLAFMTMSYWLLLVLGTVAVRKREEPLPDVFRALWICILVGALGFLSLKALGANVIHWRYTQGGLVAIILLAAGGFSLLNRLAAPAGAVVTALLLATVLQQAKGTWGTYTMIGFEDWRQAMEVLSVELEGDTLTPVLFRSGFMEEDQTPLGSPVPTTRATLRSPGREAPDFNLIPLTASWNHPEREDYFETVVLPTIDIAETFYLLSGSPLVYASCMVEWINEARPGVFEARRQNFGRVTLIRFRKAQVSES